MKDEQSAESCDRVFTWWFFSCLFVIIHTQVNNLATIQCLTQYNDELLQRNVGDAIIHPLVQEETKQSTNYTVLMDDVVALLWNNKRQPLFV